MPFRLLFFEKQVTGSSHPHGKGIPCRREVNRTHAEKSHCTQRGLSAEATFELSPE